MLIIEGFRMELRNNTIDILLLESIKLKVIHKPKNFIKKL